MNSHWGSFKRERNWKISVIIPFWPQIKTPEHGIPIPEFSRQISPWDPSSHAEQDTFKSHSVFGFIINTSS